MIKYFDIHQRSFKTLRLSITSACNLSCSYCVPAGVFAKDDRSLKTEEFLYLVYLLKEVAGINKVRITGGEPLISQKFFPILSGLAKMEIAKIGITTNGIYLFKYLPAIKKTAPQVLLNVSLDTLDEQKFKHINGKKGAKKVIQALTAATDMGLAVKVNMVPRKGINFVDIIRVLDFCIEQGIDCRFIELMKMGYITSAQFKKEFVSLAEILDIVGQKYKIEKMPTIKHSTAHYYRIKNFKKAKFGIIANDSLPFCQDCNRLRLTNQGEVYGCLSNTSSISLTHLLKLSKQQAVESLKNILKQAMKHKQEVCFAGSTNVMQSLGG